MLKKFADFIKDYDKRVALVQTQVHMLSSCKDSTERAMLERWIRNNRRILADNENTYTIYKEIIRVGITEEQD